jgi:hypothetical protein
LLRSLSSMVKSQCWLALSPISMVSHLWFMADGPSSQELLLELMQCMHRHLANLQLQRGRNPCHGCRYTWKRAGT